MKQYKLILLLLPLTFVLTSCSVVAGIFKTGMGVGVVISIAVVAGVIFVMTRSRKK